MNSIDLAKEIEGIVTDLCKCANKQDKYALAVVNEIRKELEILEQYKNIEDELGIDLITLYKALKNNIYVKTIVGILYAQVHCNGFAFVNSELNPSVYFFKDYGKTWALTREELEDESMEM